VGRETAVKMKKAAMGQETDDGFMNIPTAG
jgi:hypothetical protein